VRINITDEKIVPVNIIHRGIKEADYSIKLEGENWLSVDASEFSLSPDERYVFNVVANPDNASVGDYYANLNITLDNIVYQKSIKFKVREGKSVWEQIKEFFNYYKYWIFVAIVLLLVVLVLINYLNKKARVWRIKRMIKRTLKKEQNKKESKKKVEKKKAQKKSEKKETIEAKGNSGVGFFGIIIALIVVAFFVAIRFKDQALSYLSVAWVFLKGYYVYFIVGFVLLAVIILVLRRSEKKSKK
jgi:heme exporter protein D